MEFISDVQNTVLKYMKEIFIISILVSTKQVITRNLPWRKGAKYTKIRYTNKRRLKFIGSLNRLQRQRGHLSICF